MPRYLLHGVLVDAEPYRQGLEDGFDAVAGAASEVIRSDARSFAAAHAEGIVRPYLDTPSGRLPIATEDIILRDLDGSRRTCSLVDWTAALAAGHIVEVVE